MKIKQFLHDLLRRTFQIPNKKVLTSIINHRPQSRIDIVVKPAEMTELLAHVTRSWELLGQQKPHFSVLTSKNFLPDNFKKHEERFWNSGDHDLRLIDDLCASADLKLDGLNKCLELGCGVGRVTVKLASRFQKVIALDISKPHIELAKEHADKLKIDNINFQLADMDLFNNLPEFDFLYSRIVLQHNTPPIMAFLLEKLLARLKPGGIAIFQIPTYMQGYTFKIKDYLREANPQMEMHALPQSEVLQRIDEADCRVKHIRETGDIGNYGQWISNVFVVTKHESKNLMKAVN